MERYTFHDVDMPHRYVQRTNNLYTRGQLPRWMLLAVRSASTLQDTIATTHGSNVNCLLSCK